MSATILSFVAPIQPDRRVELEEVLAELAERARRPPYAPFGRLPMLHFASITLFDAPSGPGVDAGAAVGLEPLLVLETNFEGKLGPFLDALLRAAAAELHALLRCCRGYAGATATERTRMASYLQAHAIRPTAGYVGNVGRTPGRIIRERELRRDLIPRIEGGLETARNLGEPPRDAAAAYQLVRDELRASPWAEWVTSPFEPLAVRRRRALRRKVAMGAPVLGVILFVLFTIGRLHLWARAALLAGSGLLGLLLLLLAFALVLRRHERRDPALRPDDVHPDRVRAQEAVEDLQRQNHLGSLVMVKPGAVRRLTLWLVLFGARVAVWLSGKPALCGIPSIHFAHWAMLDGGRRLLFLSNYDGSWGSYLDDFSDKATLRLTAIWSNTVGFPRTRFLLWGGAADRDAFRAFGRMSQAPAAVWYSAYPDLSVQQIDANSVLREGLARRPRTRAALRRWVQGV